MVDEHLLLVFGLFVLVLFRFRIIGGGGGGSVEGKVGFVGVKEMGAEVVWFRAGLDGEDFVHVDDAGWGWEWC